MKWYLMIDYETEKILYGGMFKSINEFLSHVQNWLTITTQDADYVQIVNYEKEEIHDDYNVHYLTIDDIYELEGAGNLRKMVAILAAVYETDLKSNLMKFPEKLKVKS